MEGFLGGAYLWIKALHIIAVIAWMAGMLYLPRLFVYHAAAAPLSDLDETLKIMERRLLRGIVNPAMIVALVLGILLFLNRGEGIWQEGWWRVKLLMLVVMFAIHGFLSRWRRAFAEGKNPHSARFYRWINEAPAVLMVVIVLMAVAKPF
ncbi:MAG: protoporphyrinogen oxidase HemJ [Proteobacteria bacterium]|nr:protoporphyrinogen oxidase HemJ [Pseudomonadota bacterium]